MKIDIRIIKKYKFKGRVLWYYDSNGIRYYEHEVRYIIDNKKLPSEKQFLSRIYNIDIDINMVYDKSHRLRSNNGTLKTIKTDNYKEISILIEDSNSGFQFYKTLIEYAFPGVYFKFYTSNGYSGIEDIINNKRIDLVIMDNKQNSPNAVKVIEYLRKCSQEYNIHIYIPTSIEEVILSNHWLQIFKSSSLKDVIEEYFYTGSIYYTLLGDKYKIDKIGCIIDNLEKTLSSELSKISSIRYNKSKLSGCFLMGCCPILAENFKCGQFTESNKLNKMTYDSLACGLINILCLILYNKEPYLNKWSEEAKYRLYC